MKAIFNCDSHHCLESLPDVPIQMTQALTLELLVLKMASLMSIESCILAGTILLEESSEGELDAAAVERVKRLERVKEKTPAIDEMKALGKWNVAWGPFCDLAPVWTDQFMATAIGKIG